MKKKILVTGAFGFLGKWVVETLRGAGIQAITPTRCECNLMDLTACIRTVSWHRPDTIIHLAATVGGIGANQREPGRFFYENALMGMNLIETARICKVQKVVQVGTVCSYPIDAPIPFREDDLWSGYPELTNAPYGVSKKMLLTMLQAYRAQYGLRGIYLIPANLYGPGDNFNPESSHVIPALIRNFYDAFLSQSSTVKVWGTGTATREFLYVRDAAEGIVSAALKYDGVDPVNLGGGEEISIRALAEKISQMVGYGGKIVFDRTKPDGQPRRKIDTTRARERFGWSAKTPLKTGLAETIRYAKKTWTNIV